MKIEIARKDLVEAVKSLRVAVSGRHRKEWPILSYILLQAEGKLVSLSSTNGDTHIECTAPLTARASGSMTLPSRRLHSLLGALSGDDEAVALSCSDDDAVDVNYGTIHARFFSRPPEEFPSEGWDMANGAGFCLPQHSLKTAFEKVSFAICDNSARVNLTGAHVEMADGELVVAAVDGRRMSVFRQRAGIPSHTIEGFTVPSKVVAALRRLLKGEGDVEIFVGEGQVRFSFGSTHLTTKLVGGKFPDREKVIPKGNGTKVVLDRKQFRRVLSRAKVMTNDKFCDVRFTVNQGTLSFDVATPEIGEYKEEMAVDHSGEDAEVTVNPDFVQDVVRLAGSERMSLKIKDKDSPLLLEPAENPDGERYVNVIMPIRT